MQKDLNTIIATAEEMETRLEQANKDLEYLEEFLQRFPEIKGNMQKLEEYYYNPSIWMKDKEIIEKERPDLSFGIFSEDGIYITHVEIISCVKEIIREGAIYITE